MDVIRTVSNAEESINQVLSDAEITEDPANQMTTKMNEMTMDFEAGKANRRINNTVQSGSPHYQSLHSEDDDA